MADKLSMMSKDIIQENIDYISSRFPNVIKEVKNENGKLVKKIDFDVLKQELSNVVIDEKQERYQMTWPDKKKTILLANTKINATLRPDKEKSVDFDNTKNLYVEGDNLDVLKLLRETYLNKIKMIFIDPPYNTGSDFLYDDNFADSADEFLNKDMQYFNGYRMVENVDSLGKYHTNWLNNIYPRLKIARDLLTDDGVMFISIDDHEIDNLIKVCKEIFSNNNVDVMVWRKSGAGRDGKMKNTTTFRKDHEYIVVCFKNIQQLNKSFEKPNFVNEYPNSDDDPRGPYKAGSISRTEEASNPNHKNYYTVTSPAGVKFTRQFDISQEDFLRLDNDKLPNPTGKMVGRIYWGKNDDACPSIKIFVNEKRSVTTSSYILEPNEVIKSNTIDNGEATTTKGSKELEDLLDAEGLGAEMRPKPSFLIKNLIQIGTNKKDIILDFYSGSGTTAHAVMLQNVEDGGERKYICVQIPQENSDGSIARQKGYDSICSLAEERIRRAGKKILEEYNKNNKDEGLFADNSHNCKFDFGFRVLKLDSSNMNDVYYNANSTTQSLFDSTVDNVKSDRTPLDLLFQVMLELGIELSAKIEEKEIQGKKYFIVNENDIVACFDSNVNNDVIKELAQIKPIYAVFRDSVFVNDAANINCEQLFKSISPSTIIKVL